ncbi:MAG: hypothetical protein M3Q06_11530, partial [Bacteroidota bacterium]|nr:hypothetical protein [Bacteroidota bacterium]
MLVFDKWLYDAVLITGSLAAVAIFYFVIKRFFPDFLPGFWPTLFGGLLVQAFQVGGIYLILFALNIPLHHQEWIFIFLSASVITVLPLSLGGGLGTREVVFAEGASFFYLDPHLGVVISLLFYVSSVAGAVWGAWFVFHDPLEKVAGIVNDRH